jgi:hypothetical protein
MTSSRFNGSIEFSTQFWMGGAGWRGPPPVRASILGSEVSGTSSRTRSNEMFQTFQISEQLLSQLVFVSLGNVFTENSALASENLNCVRAYVVTLSHGSFGVVGIVYFIGFLVHMIVETPEACEGFLAPVEIGCAEVRGT